MTVYSRLIAYSEAQNFKFKDQHKKYIGSAVANLWRSQGHKMEDLGVIQSVENDGTWMVYDYPPSFLIDIEMIISEYVAKMKLKRKKQITEKPINNQSGPDSISSLPLSKKPRKRIPHFSGKQFKKQ